ncbi:S-layer protein [Thermococcus henrietii]|uniref:S-layer protein n=1 Tax=Thermococcus henrietii TaxID=2016361 RepID=UPI000C06DD21|nr:S-layer protein [Thermococcus henrietii]
MKVKKIAALAVGAAMIGATMGFASAQPTVPNIPKDFFVKNGQPNVKIVVGSQGAAQDVASAADIAVAIGSILYTQQDVKVTDASVVVKKDVSYDPEDIPVFDNTYVGTTRSYPDNYAGVAGWWNGGYVPSYPTYSDYYDDITISFSPDYSATDGGVWSDGVLDQSEIQTSTPVKLYNGTSVYTAYYHNDPMIFGPSDALYWKLAQPVTYTVNGQTVASFSEGYILGYTVDIKRIEFDHDQWVQWTSKYGVVPPQSIDLVIPENSVNVTIDFQLYADKYYYPSAAGVIHSGYFIENYPYHAQAVLREGATVGDTIDLFGKKLQIVDIGTPNFLGDQNTYDIVFGNYQGEYYIDKGASKQFGNYTVKVLDIDINSVKALIQVTGPEGSVTTTLDIDPTTPTPNATVLFGGKIRVQLLDTFIGIGGTTSAKIAVWTNLFGVNGEDDSLYQGWTVHFVVNRTAKLLKEIWLTNNEELKGSEINLFGQFVVKYEEHTYTDTDSYGTKHYAVDAYVAIDPAKPEYEYETYKVGDEIGDTGYYVSNITATVSPAKADVFSKVTQPITVLDTEIMAEGLNKVDSNLILVGGPVVNSVTAALADKLGIPANYSGWKAKYGTGKESGVIKYIAKCGAINDHGVVLVAGTDREGTKAAAEALMEYIANLG